jgi:uncharacterized membrane protein
MHKVAGIFMGTLLLISMASVALGQNMQQYKYQAKIIQVTNIKNINQQEQQIIIAEFQGGPYAGRTVLLNHDVNGYPTDLQYSVGNRIFIQEVINATQRRFAISGPVRADGLYRLVLLFAAGVVVVAGWQGIR